MIERHKAAGSIFFVAYPFLISLRIQCLDIAMLIGLSLVVGIAVGLLYAKFRVFQPKPSVLFLTGLSGAGKTTLALALVRKLQHKGIRPILLDGDEVRHLMKQEQFDEASRKRHNRNVGGMASLLEAQGHIVIVSLIAPYAETRAEIRTMCKNFKEVYIATALPVCIERDPKGLYAKALRGEIKEFTGISSPYFPPKAPDLTIDTAVVSIEEAVDQLYHLLKK